MIVTELLDYNLFMLMNPGICFHPGGLLATYKVTRNVPGISKESGILDFGSGNGLSLFFLQKMGFKKLYGYDVNAQLIEKAKKRFGANREILFYDALTDWHNATPEIYLMMLESIFSYIKESDMLGFTTQLKKVMAISGAKYLSVIDFYCIDQPSEAMKKEFRYIFNSNQLRTKLEVWQIINSLSPNGKVVYQEELKIANQPEVVFGNKINNYDYLKNIIKDHVASVEEAIEYQKKYIGHICAFNDTFCKNFIFFKAVVEIN